MTQKKKKGPSDIRSRAKQVLEYAQECSKTTTYSSDLSNALFSVGGKASVLFPTPEERGAFLKTREYKEVVKLINAIPHRRLDEVVDLGDSGSLNGSNGALHVRLPRSLHLALIAEAKAEGVSLDELCLSKLSAQLRSLV